MTFRLPAAFAFAAALAACAHAPSQPVAPAAAVDDVDIGYSTFTLKNGLTVIVHEDHKSPIAAVNVWYHVGSKDEPEGRSGFAHLFEHLMFTGSQHAPEGFADLLAEIGATDNNGTTDEDATHYFEDVPKNALPVALWMEAERMGWLLPAVDQEKLKRQREVVQNEKRQDENQPYGKVELRVAEATYPPGHPYHHTTIGSIQDLDAATLDDVRGWFKTYYGPNNAVLSIAGDVDTGEVRKEVEKYFGEIPAVPPVLHVQRWVAKMSGTRRESLQDRVPAARVYMVWNVPGDGEADADYLQMVADVLTEGRSSRLVKRLVYDDQLASSVRAELDAHEIGGQFTIVATALPGKPLDVIEKDIREELERLLKDGPTPREVENVKTGEYAAFVRSVERIGGFGGSSDVLAEDETFEGDPAAYRDSLKRVETAAPDDLKQSTERWLTDGVYVLDVQPYGDYGVSGLEPDRSHAPALGEFPAMHFPAQETATLANGLKIILVHRDAVPLVTVSLQVDAGYAADGAAPGTAKLAMAGLSMGTPGKDAIQISTELGHLGATFYAGSDLDTTGATLGSLKRNLPASLALFSELVLHPTYPEADVEKLRNLQLAAIHRESLSPNGMALRVFPRLLYGDGDAYGLPFTGSGYVKSVSALTSADLRRFHDDWFKPNNATLIVVGDTTLAEIRPQLQQLFGAWQPGPVPKKELKPVSPPARPAVYLMDRPGSDQSVIIAGNVAPPYDAPDNIALQSLNTILGGDFTGRINMNLREDKHWAYGAYSYLLDARGQRPFIVFAPVQTDKTAPAMLELQKELQDMIGKRTATAEELTRAKGIETRTLPGDWETNDGVASAISTQVSYDLPADYWDNYAAKVDALGLDQLKAAGQELVHPQQLIWVVVGDLAKIEPDISKLNLGDIHYIDADGNPIHVP